MSEEEKDYEAYKTYLSLWASENPIKTHKLQMLLVVNALLVAALQIAGGVRNSNWPIFFVGWLLSLIWVMSIGRTSLFQKTWQMKAKEISAKYVDDPRFQILETDGAEQAAPFWLQIPGSVSSKYYLLGVPVLFAGVWAWGLLFVVWNRYD